MMGNLTITTDDIFLGTDLRIHNYYGDGIGVLNSAGSGFRDVYANIVRALKFISNWNDDLEFQVRSNNGYVTIVRGVHADIPYLEIPCDITMVDDKFLKIGKDSDGVLPAIQMSDIGKLIYVGSSPTRLYMGALDSEGWPLWKQIQFVP